MKPNDPQRIYMKLQGVPDQLSKSTPISNTSVESRIIVSSKDEMNQNRERMNQHFLYRTLNPKKCVDAVADQKADH